MDNQALESVVSTEVERLGFECVKVEIVGPSKKPVVRLYIDKPGGVGVKDCSIVSRSIGLVLDDLDPFPGRYLLEVSSPGNNRPLTKENHFERFVGHMAKIHVVDEEGKKKTYIGTIKSCGDNVLVLSTKDNNQIVNLTSIVKANLVGEVYKIDKKKKNYKDNEGGKR
jgi:ribosome maturation factor RimP